MCQPLPGPLAHVEEETIAITQLRPPGWIGGPARGACGIAVVIVVEFARVWVPQWAQGVGGRDAGGEAAAAKQVQVEVLERGQPRDVLVAQLMALALQLGNGGVDVLRGLQSDGVEDQAERAELVLHSIGDAPGIADLLLRPTESGSGTRQRVGRRGFT